MDTLTLCGWSAFQWHRIPPLVKMLHLAGGGDDACLDELLDASSPLFGGIDWPLHAHARDVNHKPARRGLVEPHLCSAIDASCLVHTSGCIAIMDPLATLLTLAQMLSCERLALAGSEMCSGFAIFRPDTGLQAILDQVNQGDLSPLGDYAEDAIPEIRFGWQQARDLNGRPTDLWKRPALLTISQIEEYVAGLPVRTQGRTRLRDACKLMVAGAASPLEAKAAILLGQPRRRGGEHLGPVQCNLPIPLNPEARQIARQSICYGDLCFTGPNGRLLDIECHSKTWHDSSKKALSDMARATALECMGVEVLFLTDEQLRDDMQAAEIARRAREKLGIKLTDPAIQLLAKRTALREQILVDWKSFGIRSLY